MDSEGGIVFMKWNFRSLFLIVLAVCLALPFNGLAVSPRDISISVQWTDGWGTVVRDENGDGKPDYVSYDSGETWQKTK